MDASTRFQGCQIDRNLNFLISSCIMFLKVLQGVQLFTGTRIKEQIATK